jgi:Protein phosphatase inhibitor 2 (IPP-2)
MSEEGSGVAPPGASTAAPGVAAAASEALEDAEMTRPSSGAAVLDREIGVKDILAAAGSSTTPAPAASGSSKQKKKPRLQWDEENLIHNALEKDRNNYQKIDEPKTPFHTMSGSEGGSVSSGSAPHSPGSPAFLSRDNLVGFSEVERSAQRERNGGTPSSADRGSSDSRSVHIAEDASSDGESSPRSQREFESKRKLHYQKEHPRFHTPDPDDDDDDVADAEEVVTPDVIAARERANGANGRADKSPKANGGCGEADANGTASNDEAD